MALTVIDIILGIILIGLLVAIAVVYRKKEQEHFNESLKKRQDLVDGNNE